MLKAEIGRLSAEHPISDAPSKAAVVEKFHELPGETVVSAVAIEACAPNGRNEPSQLQGFSPPPW
jgi:hypothetical protein